MNVHFLKLTSYSDRIESELVSSFLEGNGIFVLIKSDDAGGINNSMTASNGVHLYVSSTQFEEAKALLEADITEIKNT
jgi:hypothetical protein